MMENYQDTKCLALEKALDDESGDPIVLSFSFLNVITKEFSNNQLIGSGGFGSVYKGELRNGMVAVKKLHDKIEVLEKNFQSEVDCLIKVKHKNIVRFLGYCSETQHLLTPYGEKYVWADVRQRLFCFEYLSKGSLAEYLTEASSGLPWRVRYQIIKGICEGVDYLHQHNIIHMDLKPQNILMDGSMVPKIADFGLSRRLSEKQSRTITENIVGTLGYLAPEYLSSKTITFKIDIYSLGVIIMEILMGCKERPDVKKVLESWMNTLGTSESHPLLEQVKVCAEIGINCMDENPRKRPAIHDIICSLHETDISSSSVRSVASSSSAVQLVYSSAPSQQEQSALGRFYQHYRLAKKACKPMRISAFKGLGETSTELNPGLSESGLLDVHPLELSFPFVTKTHTQCSLDIINRTDRYVAYWIRPQFPDMYAHLYKPILGPMFTRILDVTMVKQEQPPLDAGMFEILMISMGSKSDLIHLVLSIIDKDCKIDDDLLKQAEDLFLYIGGNPETGDSLSMFEADRILDKGAKIVDLLKQVENLMTSIGREPKIDGDLLKRVEELGGEVHAAILTAVTCAPRDPHESQILSTVEFGGTGTIDAHPIQPWVLVGNGKYLYIWDYKKEEKVVTIDVDEEAGMLYHYLTRSETEVCTVRFIHQRQWFVAGDNQGCINVYTCLTMKAMKRFKAGRRRVESLAVHPTCSYLLSACGDGVIKIWDWDMGWDCAQIVQLSHNWIRVRFNPNDTHTFTSCDDFGRLKVFSTYPSVQPITTIEQRCGGHSAEFDHVLSKAGQNHVVVIGSNCLLNIWDLETGTRVHTLNDPQCHSIDAVACHPTLPLIAAGTVDAYDHDGHPVVQFWNSTNYRLEKIVSCTSGDKISYLGFVGSRRLVVETIAHCEQHIEVLEIDMESLLSLQ